MTLEVRGAMPVSRAPPPAGVSAGLYNVYYMMVLDGGRLE